MIWFEFVSHWKADMIACLKDLKALRCAFKNAEILIMVTIWCITLQPVYYQFVYLFDRISKYCPIPTEFSIMIPEDLKDSWTLTRRFQVISGYHWKFLFLGILCDFRKVKEFPGFIRILLDSTSDQWGFSLFFIKNSTRCLKSRTPGVLIQYFYS